MKTPSTVSNHLIEQSRRQHIAFFDQIHWPDSLDEQDLLMSPELLSLYQIPWFETLNEAQVRKLALLELCNFFSLNIHGERHLMAGMSARLHQQQDTNINRYLHHFIDEENKHMHCFAEFCRRYAGFIYEDGNITFPRSYAPGEEDFLFFGKALIFEELVDVYNARMAKDQRLCSLSRQINHMHHVEESRHRAFGRSMVQQMFADYATSWSEEVLQGIRDYLSRYLQHSWQGFYNTRVYAALDLHDKQDLQNIKQQAWQSGTHHRQSCSAPIIGFLLDSHILLEEPTL